MAGVIKEDVDMSKLHDNSSVRSVGFAAVPEYAIANIAYGDSSGLSEEDVKAIDRWMSDNNLDHLVDCGKKRFFSYHPEFGPPAMCVSASFLKKSAVRQKDDASERLEEKVLANQIVASGTVRDVNTVQGGPGNLSISFSLLVRDGHGSVSRIPCRVRGKTASAVKDSLTEGNRINVIGRLIQDAPAPEGFFKPSVVVEHLKNLPSVKKTVEGHYVKEEPASDVCDLFLSGTVDRLFTPEHVFFYGNNPEVRACRVVMKNGAGRIMCQGDYHFGNDRILPDFNPVPGERIRLNGRLYEQEWLGSDDKVHSALFVHPLFMERIQERKPERKEEPAVEKDSGGWEY